jgi:N-acetylglucosamine malate deacetylase 2
MKKILAVFAHPDDESFGPGGTLSKYAQEGVEIHLLCATRGEAGQMDERIRNKELRMKNDKKIYDIRSEELLQAAKILGIKKVEFLDYIDGTLCNAIYHELADKIIKKIREFKPDIVITEERRGVSGHLDHIAVSMITTFAFQKTKIAKKLYYHCLSRKVTNIRKLNYFVYFPEGYSEQEITTRIDYKTYWDIKKKAMQAHKSQWKDVTALLAFYSLWPKVDTFILQEYHRIKPVFPETDLFSGFDD